MDGLNYTICIIYVMVWAMAVDINNGQNRNRDSLSLCLSVFLYLPCSAIQACFDFIAWTIEMKPQSCGINGNK